MPAAADHSGSAQAQGRGDAAAWGSDGEETMTQTEILIEGYRRDWARAEEKRLEALIEQEESDLAILQAALEVLKRDAGKKDEL